MIKPRTNVNWHIQPYIYIKFGDFSVNDDPRIAKKAWLI